MRILLIAIDNGLSVSFFPHSIAYVASSFINAGAEVHVYNQDVYHYDEAHLSTFLLNERFDAVGLSFVSGAHQYRKVINISNVINSMDNRPFYMLGGHGPAPEAEYFLKKTGANIVICGEGENTSIDIYEHLKKRKALADINGIAYLNNNNFTKTIDRKLISNIDDIAYPAWGLFPINHYALLKMPNSSRIDRTFSVLSGRGCLFNCNFCYRIDTGFRYRSAKSIVEEIKYLKAVYSINYIVFTDDLLMSSELRTEEICNEIIASGLNIKWYCNGRLNFANVSLLRLMNRAGCVFINYGIESLDQQVLNKMNKNLKVKQIYDGIENTLKARISPGLNIIFGNIGDTINSLNKSVEFMLKYDDCAQLRTLRPVTPYPGSPLYSYAIEKGLLKDAEDFYENKHISPEHLTVNFTNLSDREFNDAMLNANINLIENYFENRKEKAIAHCKKFYNGATA